MSFLMTPRLRAVRNSSRVTETTVGFWMSAYSVMEMWQWLSTLGESLLVGGLPACLVRVKPVHPS